MHIVAVVFVWLNLREFDVKKYAAIYWYGGLSMIGQESLSCSKWKPRVLWLHTCVAIFIAVFGIILNLMSSDSIVIRDPPRIDSIDDMFIEPFSSFKVYMYKTTTFYNYMRNAPPGSAMAAVFKRASDRSNCSRLIDCGEIEFRTDPQGSLKLLSFYDELVASRDHALFTADMIMDQAMAPSACRFRPELVNTTYTSIGHVSSEILTFMARKGIDREVETYLNFRIQTSVIEAGFTYQYALGFVDRIFEQLMPHVAKKTGYYYRCVEGLKDENEQLVLPLEIKQWRKAAIFIAVSIGVSSLLLLLETLIRRKNHRRRGRRKKVRQELLSEAIAVSPTAQ
ncbi:hypothetical protein HDE_06501 [Halotydeus destructor]|nr:hypothetical protein HDE_06501 [Halotydeus destructor]